MRPDRRGLFARVDAFHERVHAERDRFILGRGDLARSIGMFFDPAQDHETRGLEMPDGATEEEAVR